MKIVNYDLENTMIKCTEQELRQIQAQEMNNKEITVDGLYLINILGPDLILSMIIFENVTYFHESKKELDWFNFYELHDVDGLWNEDLHEIK